MTLSVIPGIAVEPTKSAAGGAVGSAKSPTQAAENNSFSLELSARMKPSGERSRLAGEAGAAGSPPVEAAGAELPPDGNALPVGVAMPAPLPVTPAPGFSFSWTPEDAKPGGPTSAAGSHADDPPIVADGILSLTLPGPAVVAAAASATSGPSATTLTGSGPAALASAQAPSPGSDAAAPVFSPPLSSTLSPAAPAVGSVSMPAMTPVAAGVVAATGAATVNDPSILPMAGSETQPLSLWRDAGLLPVDGGASSSVLPGIDGAAAQPGGIGALSALSAQAALQAAAGLAGGQPGSPLAMAGPDWSNALAQRVGWMLEGQMGRAEIALDPPELGPLQVRISTHNDQTQVQFVSQHAAVRDALDQAMPRLREMLEAQGMQLVQADVSSQSQGESQRQLAGSPAGSDTASAADASSAVDGGTAGTILHHGLIDAYA